MKESEMEHIFGSEMCGMSKVDDNDEVYEVDDVDDKWQAVGERKGKIRVSFSSVSKNVNTSLNE